MIALEEILTQIKEIGALTDEEIAALRAQNANVKMLQNLLEMYQAGTKQPLRNVGAKALETSRSSRKEKITPSGEEVKPKLAEKEKLEGFDQPLTLEELESMLPEAVKDATTFEPSPEWNPTQDPEKSGPSDKTIMVRIGRIFKGNYDQPLVVASEWAPYNMEKKTLGEVQDGYEGKKGVRLPTFAVRRMQEKKVPIVADLVYLFAHVGTKPTKFGNDFNQVAIIGPFPDFPKPKKA